ncbi:hypothetical protein Y032_0109g113 [Ancylostoma ceylanicum]|uniref:Uncharacterized protein n=1 Tax=Ancylostoma ceylanicum TaxID=53326 RepID=A0A016TEQ9_9BILA|nr:hypothetical protein Y032_0109g113 [Ancylostoma ceylanicum]
MCYQLKHEYEMRFSIRTFFAVLLMIVSAAAYLSRQMRLDMESARESRSAPDFDQQYANNFYRGYGSDARFGPGPEYNQEGRYW